MSTQTLGAFALTQYNAISPSAPFPRFLTHRDTRVLTHPLRCSRVKILIHYITKQIMFSWKDNIKINLKRMEYFGENSWYCDNETAGSIKETKFVN